MRASVYVLGMALAALAVCTMGLPAADTVVEEAVPKKSISLYHQQAALFDGLLEEDEEVELMEVPPADLNADNGTPINVAASSVHEEGFRFVQYEFSVAQARCSDSTTKPFVVTEVQTSVAEGIDYAVKFTYGGSPYSMKVLRNPIGNPKEAPGQQEVVRDEFSVVSIEPTVCAAAATWTATQYPEFEGLSETEFSTKYFGDKDMAPSEFTEVDKVVTEAEEAGLPPNFDWRDHMGKSEGMKVKKQGACASCYAMAAASVMSDRFYIASKGRINVDISPQSIMDCSEGCHGGTASDAFKAMMEHKAAPGWCDPYTGSAGTCGAHSCDTATEYRAVVQGDHMATLGIQGSDKMSAIMYQLYHYGPVYMRMEVYSDFPYYRSGVYKHQSSAQVRGDHAVKLVGYGEEGSVKYWLAQNSWGDKWGEKGFFRIARGVDESGVESRGVFWAIPDTAAVCPKAPACNNGGSFTATCGCHCADGYSGPTCDVCDAKCAGVGFSGSLRADSCACECAPGYFDGDVDGKFTKCGLKIGGAKGVVHGAIAAPPCVNSETDSNCASWKEQGYCGKGSKYSDYTTARCEKSCGLCDTTPSAQVPVMVSGKLAYQYGDMVVSVPAGKQPWNIHDGWAKPAYYSFVCGPETRYEDTLYCEDQNPVTVKIKEAGAYDLYMYKYLGKNLLGQSRGWTAHPLKLVVGACAGEKECAFPTDLPKKPPGLDDTQRAEVAQRVADASLSAAERAKAKLQEQEKQFLKAEKETHHKILKAAADAHKAELKKEAAEMKVKKKARTTEAKELAHKTTEAVAGDKAKAKEIDEKRAAEAAKSKVADEKRHYVVEAITHHKKVLDKLGEISAKLAAQQAHIDATAAMAAKEKSYKVGKAQAIQKTVAARGEMKAAMKKAAELAKAAAEAQNLVKQDTVKEKMAKQHQLEATQKSKEADKAFKINQEFKLKHSKTSVVHQHWEVLSAAAEKNVTVAKQVAVAAMEDAQCIIKDKRSGCKQPQWKGHCQTKKWKAWMMTHCTESCGFSCTDLHDLAMGVVLKAEAKARKREEKARKEACPKFNNMAIKFADFADKYGRMATQYVQPCKMRAESEACADVKKFSALSKKFEKKHLKFKAKMQHLKCYEYSGQWAAGHTSYSSGVGAAGSAAGQKLLRLMEAGSKVH
jgi:C1A family cysteine protease